MPERLTLWFAKAFAKAGRAGVAFLLTSSIWLLLALLNSTSIFRDVFALGAWITGLWLTFRLARWIAGHLVWRLRHRLIVTYLFVAVAPVVLLIAIAQAAAYLLLLQVGMNVVTTELDHRLTETAALADAVRERPNAIESTVKPFFTRRYPDLAVAVRSGTSFESFPPGADVPPPVTGFQASRAIIRRGTQFYLWANRKTSTGDVTVLAPLNDALLAQLAPEIGSISLEQNLAAAATARRLLPTPASRFDIPFFWFATLRAAEWEHPTEASRDVRLAIETRMSTVLAAVFNRKADVAQSFVQFFVVFGIVLFVLVEIVCWIIGVWMTRSITNTVHHLYQGTQHIAEGRFSHRMPIAGRDQLAEVGTSFNRMTAHIEQLVDVAKEKERLQSEIEIAQEVQGQLYPTLEPRSPHLRVAAVYRSARIVSGDYFDYTHAGPGRVALAIGDVAGKGISAALLMASIQSSLRTQVSHGHPQTSNEIVARLNRHLCASTSSEKYATFCLGLYDESTGALAYTNAGHIPPVIVRSGDVLRFDVNGTVVGAFSHAAYESSSVALLPGDLIAWFTDGLTEPENEFGEMFGDDRVYDVLLTHAHRDEQSIAHELLEAVRQWTGKGELQDDITLMLVRRL
jgi:phosphoserine phosphatase RsbU/P